MKCFNYYYYYYNSALLFLANSLQAIEGSSLYADLNTIFSPSVITGEQFRPDLLLITEDKSIFIPELAVGFETNLNNNAERKRLKYRPLISDMSLSTFLSVHLVSLAKHPLLSSKCVTCLILINNAHTI